MNHVFLHSHSENVSAADSRHSDTELQSSPSAWFTAVYIAASTRSMLPSLHLCAMLSRFRLVWLPGLPGLQPTRLLCPWDSPGQRTGVGCPAFLQRISPTQGLNPGLLHGRWILYRWDTGEAPSPHPPSFAPQFPANLTFKTVSARGLSPHLSNAS